MQKYLNCVLRYYNVSSTNHQVTLNLPPPQENTFLPLCTDVWFEIQMAVIQSSINLTSKKSALKGPPNGPSVTYSKIKNRSCGAPKTTPID